jgi:hypothetical protein
MSDDARASAMPIPANRRMLTPEERSAVLSQLVVPGGGWAAVDGNAAEQAKALDQRRWHTFVDEHGQTWKQDIVTGTVRTPQRMSRRARRANKALVRRQRSR